MMSIHQSLRWWAKMLLKQNYKQNDVALNGWTPSHKSNLRSSNNPSLYQPATWKSDMTNHRNSQWQAKVDMRFHQTCGSPSSSQHTCLLPRMVNRMKEWTNLLREKGERATSLVKSHTYLCSPWRSAVVCQIWFSDGRLVHWQVIARFEIASIWSSHPLAKISTDFEICLIFWLADWNTK